MTIDVLTSGDVTIFMPVGRLDSNNSSEAETTVISQLDGGASRVVFDFDRMDYISSAGLRVVLMAAKRLRGMGGKLALCNLKPHIREIFEMSGFLSILTVCNNRMEAEQAIAG